MGDFAMRIVGLFSLLILFGLSGCGGSAKPVTVPPQFKQADFNPVPLNARRLEIVENWQMPMQAPYIGHFQNPYPSNIVAQWAARVLQPAGGSGEIIFDISRAAITEIELAQKAGLKNSFTDQQETKIKVELAGRLMWLQPVGGQRGMVNLSAFHSVTIPESATANEYNAAVQTCLLAALKGLDEQARSELATMEGIVLP
jgi:hypothetical protein